MAGLHVTSGSKLHIGGPMDSQTDDFVVGDFSSQSFVEVKHLETLGEFGDESAMVTFNSINEARIKKFKGSRDAGDMAIVCGIDHEDEGQQNIRLAQATDFSYAIRVDFDDKDSVDTTPSYRYFIAKVMSVREALGEADNVMRLNFTLAIDSNIVRADPA